jgi:hypothetical protein
MSQPQILLAGVLLSDKKMIHLRETLRMSFLRMHYVLHDPALYADEPFPPTQETLDYYAEKIEMLYLLDPEYFDEKWKLKNLFTINEGVVTLHFTLQECVERHHKKYQEWRAKNPQPKSAE